jgi:hypothetical protein
MNLFFAEVARRQSPPELGGAAARHLLRPGSRSIRFFGDFTWLGQRLEEWRMLAVVK